MAYRRDYPPLYPAVADAGADRRRDVVHEDHPALSRLGTDQSCRYVRAGSVGVVHAAAAVHSAKWNIAAVRRSVLLGFSRVLDSADGLPAAADGA
ncbi:hypothetical protein D3C78_1287520 [compost metagenome]